MTAKSLINGGGLRARYPAFASAPGTMPATSGAGNCFVGRVLRAIIGA
jgi:hypothetical protein